jgi:ankyrin repeat protein
MRTSATRMKAPATCRALIGCMLCSLLATAPTAADDQRLVDAVQRQDRVTARTLLQQHVDANSRQADGATAIAWAAHWDDLETADLLIRAGADVNAPNDLGVTPLALACNNGSVSMADKLLSAGANAKTASASVEAPLAIAARTGNPNLVKTLIAHGAEINGATPALRQTALMYAISEGHSDVARVLLEAGADASARSAGGFTPLLFAARQGDTGSARLLLDAGVDVNEAARDGSTALVVATASGREDVALLLLERGANPNAAGAGYSALHAAVSKDLQSVVAALLKRGADPNARLKTAPATLFGPAKGSGSEVMPIRTVDTAAATRPLQDAAAGSGPGGRPARGGASGAAAAGAGRRPATMGAGGLSGATPFWLAARNVNVPIMRTLLGGGADPSLTTDSGVTPLMVAAGLTQVQGPRTRRGDVSSFYSNWGPADSLETTKFLILLGADVNAVNPSGQTALHGAAYMGADDVVRLLVQSGAKLNVQDSQGQTPYRLAEGHLNVAGQGVTEWPTTAAVFRELGADTSLGVDGHAMLREYVRSGGGAPGSPTGASPGIQR